MDSKTPADSDRERDGPWSHSLSLANGETSNIIEKGKKFCFNFSLKHLQRIGLCLCKLFCSKINSAD